MTRGILIVGNSAPVTAAFVNEAKTRVQKLATAFIPAPVGSLAPTMEPDAEALPWNPSSPISARSLVLAARNRLSQIDEAVLVCSPLALRRRPEALQPAEIDAFIDDMLKGWFLLARELSLYFSARKSGTLALALGPGGSGGATEDAPDLMGAPVQAAFQALAQGLLDHAGAADYRIMGFSATESGQEAEFAAFAFRKLDAAQKKDSGRWHRYGKGGLLGFLPQFS